MTDQGKALETGDLDDLLAQARANPPVPNPDLLARVQADALAQQPRAPARAPAAPRSWLPEWLLALGGWPTAAGLGAVALTGVLIGFAPPDALSETLGIWLYGDSLWLDPLTAFDLTALEG